MEYNADLTGVNFTAVDFETANGKLSSICQIGLVRVENGIIVKELDFLVQPPANEYHWGNVKVHGIKSVHTYDKPTFDHFWPELLPFIHNQVFVAHNVQFDSRCLQETLRFYNLKVPPFKTQCTVKIYKRNLKFLADMYGIPLLHHNALSDAKACAALYLRYVKEQRLLAYK